MLLIGGGDRERERETRVSLLFLGGWLVGVQSITCDTMATIASIILLVADGFIDG